MNESWKSERRLVLRLLNYWEQLRGARAFPAPSDIDPAVLADDWADCLMLDVREPPTASIFRYIGARLAPADRPSTIGHTVAETSKGSLLRPAAAFIPTVLDKRAPVSIGGQHESTGAVLILYRAILMPLSTDGRGIDALFGGANWRPVDLHGAAVVDPPAASATE